jgi:hydrophobic/amphiphilic exporter-1 (mainly G- bacteria), HAE1 family
MWLSDLAIRRPVFTTMVAVMLMVMGVVALVRLPVDFFPEVSLPIVSVVVPYPGASPSQVEEEVVRPIEDAVAGIGGLDDIQSMSRENVGIVVVMFAMDVDLAVAADELRDRVSALRSSFPEGVDEPMYRRIDPAAMPVMTFAVASDRSSLQTRTLAEESIKPRIEQLRGVGAVDVKGGEEREIQIELDLPKMAELRIPLMRVVQQVGYDTVDIPGGQMEVGAARIGLRSRGQVESLDELGSIVVQPLPSPIFLRDIAQVVDGRATRTTLARVDGKRAVTFDVIKESGSNTVEVCDRSMKAVEEIQADLPPGVVIEPVYDGSIMARDMLHEMKISLVVGALMAILVVYLFMVDWRSTVISATALPTSVFATFFFMWIAGFSLNTLSLLGLALAIGILIDDAVVVREVIYRHLERGENPFVAASRGTREVGLAVLATTLSILAVFIPVGFVGGFVGQFFREFGYTVAIAVSISLFIAFTVDPMLSARISKVVDPESRGRMARGLIRFWSWVDDRYRSLLAVALSYGKTVVALSLVLFLGSLLLLSVVGSEFIPKYDRSEFRVSVVMAPFTSLTAAEEVAARIEALVSEIDEVRHIYTVVGPDGETDRIEMAAFTTKKGERKRSIYEIQGEARARLKDLPSVTITVADPPIMEGGPGGAPIEVEIRGEDLGALQEAANHVRMGLRSIDGTTGIRSTYRSGRPELQLHVDREKAARAGIGVGQIGIASRIAVAGQLVGKFRDGDNSYDIRMRAREADRTPRHLLPHLLLISPLPRLDDPYGLGTPVALRDLARVEYETAASSIERHDRRRFLKVSCNIDDRPLSDVQQDVQRMLDELPVADGVDLLILGEVEGARDALGSLLLALGLAILFIYAVLASQFDSFVHPFTIMLSLPLAVVGAFLTLFLMGWPVGIPTMLGIILLMGLVTKNAILLVDRTNQLREAGSTIADALLEAGHLRLRPILMTSLAMILGMLPAAISTGSGSEIRQPMALPVIGGLIASTLLTLVVVPVVYLWIESFRERLKGRRGSGENGVKA